MAISLKTTSFVSGAAQTIKLSSMFNVTPDASNPGYLVLTGLDRNEYTASSTGATGSLNGNGHQDTFSAITSMGNLYGDGRGVGVVFTYDSSSGRYYNSTYGYFDQMTYTTSSSAGDVTNLSLYSAPSQGNLTSNAANPFNIMAMDAGSYLGSVTTVTQPGYPSIVPTQATASSVVAAALAMVGKACNINGCWVLASTIAADAGASLPLQSTLLGGIGTGSGEWTLAYDGYNHTGDWQSMLKAGEVIAFTNGKTAHIATCVSGSGSTAMLVDNMAALDTSGHITNLANDGSGNDVRILAPHLASQELAGIAANAVQIYQLDAPVVTVSTAANKMALNTTQALSKIFSASDPANQTIKYYQVYDTAAADSLVILGHAYSAHSTPLALTVQTLDLVSLGSGSTACTDTVMVRASNGSYWGDWQPLTVTVGGAASPPTVTSQTANQTWSQGQAVSLVLPASTFTDPNGQSLTYTATQTNGQALPSWLSFNAATDTFSGTTPWTGPQTLSIKVTATDTGNLSTSETFNVSVAAPKTPLAPVVTDQTTTQTWALGKAACFTLAADTFSDPNGQALTYSATQANGQALPSWLKFDPGSQTFSGTAPSTAQSVSIKVMATDTGHLASSEIFTLNAGTITPPAAGAANTLQNLGGWMGAGAIYAGTAYNGNTIVAVKFTDVGQGGSYFDYNGQIIDNASITLTPAQVANLRLDAGNSSGKFTFQVSVEDSSGQWSNTATGNLTVQAPAPTPAASKPMVGMCNASLGVNGSMPLSAVVNTYSPTGTAIAKLTITDIGQGGSYFDYNGQTYDNTSLTVTPAQLTSVHLDAGGKAGSYTYQVTAQDVNGLVSDAAIGHLTVTAPTSGLMGIVSTGNWIG